MLVPIARTNLPPTTINVPGPGPPEPSRAPAQAATGDLLQTDAPPPQNGASADLTGTRSSESQESPEDGGDDDEAVVPQATSSDPYAALDAAFGGYMADEPRPQNKDLLDMI